LHRTCILDAPAVDDVTQPFDAEQSFSSSAEVEADLAYDNCDIFPHCYDWYDKNDCFRIIHNGIHTWFPCDETPCPNRWNGLADRIRYPEFGIPILHWQEDVNFVAALSQPHVEDNLFLNHLFSLHPVDYLDYLDIAEDALISLFRLPDLNIISNDEFFLFFLSPFSL
jgi:hypothetical protein